MSALTAVADCSTMLRRNLLHLARYPSLTVLIIGMPVVFLLLFVYVFGGTLGAGIGGGRAEYLAYVAPTIVFMTITAVAQGTSIAVAMDMTEGIIARFRTMAVFRPSVLTGHVIASIVQMFLGMAVVLGIAVALGYRPGAGPLDWLTLLGLLLLVSVAITWFSVGCGLASPTVEAASNLPMPLILLPFLGSGFVPTESMPVWLRWFSEYQPFTPIMNAIRALFDGQAAGTDGWLAVGWCLVITVLSFWWARKLYARDPIR
jgi:ABC-2 type transport system permease protein